MTKPLLQNILVAIAYFLFARLGLLLAVPPGYATAVWPSSGIALGAVLVGGYRLLPGVWLGSFAANLATGFDAATGVMLLRSLSIPAGIGCGAALQAAAAVWAIRRWLSCPSSMVEDKDILRFYALGGPLGCLVNASFSVPLLVLSGRISTAEAGWNWFTWWAGDTIGCIIFAPLLLMLFGEPRAVWRYRFRAISLPLLVSFALAVAVFIHERSEGQQRQRQAFEHRAAVLAAVLRDRLEDYSDVLLSIKALFDASQQVTREEFRLFAGQPLLHKQGLLAVAWAARVTAAEREAFEQAHRAEGWADLHITEKAADGRMVPAKPRAEYVVVDYLEPLAGNEAAFGYDLASEPLRRAALQQARATGGAAVTMPLILVPDTGAQKGVLLVAPVFDKAAPESLAGFVAVALRVEDMVRSVLTAAGVDRQGIRFMLEDRDADPANQELFRDPGLTEDHIDYSIPLTFSGRHWEARFVNTPASIMTSWALGYVFAGGLMFTGLLGGFLLILTGRTLRVEGIVRDRTLALVQQNERLSGEIRKRERMEQVLRDSQSRLHAIVESEPACVKVVAPDGSLLEMNPAGLAMIEADSAQEAIGQCVFNLVAPGHREAFQRFHERVCAGQGGTLQFEIVGLKGGRKWMESHAVPLPGVDGAPASHLAITLDITARREAENRLQLAALVFTEANEGIVITDVEGTIIDVNETFIALTGYGREEVIGRNPRLLQSGRQGPEFYAGMWEALKRDGRWCGEVWNRRKNGELYAELLTISAVRDAAGQVTHYLGLFSDITLIKEQQQRLEYLAYYDSLTQLPNRALLADRLQLLLVQAQRADALLAVCYLDLDFFKPVNDAYGHQTGDTLLMEVATRFKDSLRAGDTVARLGGDEFVLLLAGLGSVEECNQTLDRLRDRLAAPFSIDGHEITVSVSIGVTLFPLDGANPDTLLRHADQAMYQAKQAGRNRYHFFDAENDRQARAHREALERIQAALPKGEFVLYYQPKVDMRRGRVIGAEALIRWQHPERGLVAPGEFIPLIEGTDFSATLGEWVIAQALRQMRDWKSDGLELPVSVNISARHLMQSTFCQRLMELLAACPDVPPQMLELEILETAAFEDIHRVSEVMEECRKLGVSFALDDFGTGYSSLSYLRRLPVDVLKIDQSFVRDMLHDADDLAIISGIIGLARAFLRHVIAEGVETPGHGAVLMQMGCDLAQGYGITRPMPAEDLPGWVAAFTPDPTWTAERKM
jgi:diguanylate cyclase (GGDEF)-like protein/PAS domain S-box-containing protein